MKLAIPMVFAISLITGMSYGMHAPIFAVFARHEIGATYLHLEEIGMIFFVPYMVFPIFVGILLDRYKSGYFLVLSVALHSASVYLLSFASTVPELMGLRLITGISTAFFHPVCKFIISTASSEKRRVRNIAWFFGFYVAGYTIGPFIGALLLEGGGDGEGDRMLFQITAYMVAAGMAAAVYLVRDRDLPSPMHVYDRADRRPGMLPAGEMRRFPTLMTIIMYSAAVEGVLFSIFPAFLDDGGISEVDIEFLFFAWGVARISVMLAVDRIVRWAPYAMAAAAAAMAAGMLASFSAHSIEMFVAGMVLMGAGLGASVPLALEVMISRSKKERVGNVIGAYEVMFGMGWILGLLVVGEVSELIDTALPYLILFLAGAGITALLVARRASLRAGIGA